MSLYSDVIAYLKANTSATIARPTLRDQDSLPAFVVTRRNSRRGYNFSGADSGYSEDYAITAWADTHLAAQTLADEVIALLDGFTGLIGTTRVHLTQITSEVDVFDRERDREGRTLLIEFFHN